jgi:trehalose synthase
VSIRPVAAVVKHAVEARRVEQLIAESERLRSRLDGAAVLNVSSTAIGGGVAEMLQMLLPYVRGAGIDARWYVLDGDERFFAITKRLHNHLYGTAGDGGPLGHDEHRHYQHVLSENARQLAVAVHPGDIVISHDPQPAGLATAVRDRGARVIWRSHIGSDTTNGYPERGWDFLRRYLAPPAADEIESILAAVGLLSGPHRDSAHERADGTVGRIEHGADLIRTGPPPERDVPLLVQVSRWDRLKDMVGVMHGFSEYVGHDEAAHLVLAGPVVTSIADDPAQAAVLMECWDAWRALPHHARKRVALACIPDQRRRGERRHRQCVATPSGRRRPEEPGGRRWTDGQRGDVRTPPSRRQRCRRHRRPRRRRRDRRAAAGSDRSQRARRLAWATPGRRPASHDDG